MGSKDDAGTVVRAAIERILKDNIWSFGNPCRFLKRSDLGWLRRPLRWFFLSCILAFERKNTGYETYKKWRHICKGSSVTGCG